MFGPIKNSLNQYETEPKILFSDIDHRKNIYEIKDRGGFYRIAEKRSESVACMIHHAFFSLSHDGSYFLDSRTLSERLERRHEARCGEQEHFRDELAPASATAFLVGDRFMLTAGHCVCKKDSENLDEARIKKTWIVFGFQKNSPRQSDFRIEGRDIYKIKKIVAHRYTKEKDWALIKLDRAVEGRSPLPLDSISKIYLNTDLYMLGHPSGLPLKFTDGAKIRAISPSYFHADLDGFQGNSGSPVFDKTRHFVIGILVRGPRDDYHVTHNYRNTGYSRVQARRAVSAFEGYEHVQKVNQLYFVHRYFQAKRGDANAQYQIALSYNYGKKGVPENYIKAKKWLQKAAAQGHRQSRIELKTFPEKTATRVLTLRGKGLCYYQTADTAIQIAAVLTGIVTLPLFAIPGMQLAVRGMQSLESRVFELLALDDERFNLFKYISSGDFDRAEEEMEKHADFYYFLVKTYAFKVKLSTSKPEYIRFFQNKNMISQDFWLMPRYSVW
jgi:V8-like Glu-specific endopeptidase